MAMDKDRQVISVSIFRDDIHKKKCQEKGRIDMWLKFEFHNIILYHINAAVWDPLEIERS